MTSRLPTARAVGAALICVALVSCSLMNKSQKAKPVPPEPVAHEDPLPVDTHKFEIDPEDDVVGLVQLTTSTKEDTLPDIARRFNIGYEEIVRANPGVDPWLPGAGRSIVVPTQFILPDAPREGVVINIAAMRLYYFVPRKSGEPQRVITHPIGIGRVGWATPQGTTKIIRRQKDPTWRPPVSVIKEHRENGEELPAVVGPGPDNPLGRHAFYLGWPTYLIHGTNKPYGVGLRSSHGCIRLYPEDIASLFDSLPVGTKVHVVNQPFVFGWHEGQLYLQAYDVLEDDARDWAKAQKKLLSKSLANRIQKELKKRNEEVNWDRIAQLAHEPRGIPVSVSLADSSIEQVLASAVKVQNRVPEGATWDGKTDLPMDEKTLQEVLSDRDPTESEAAGGSGKQPKSGT
jgi:L,D-transpeptidase ErfK/SrfK